MMIYHFVSKIWFSFDKSNIFVTINVFSTVGFDQSKFWG